MLSNYVWNEFFSSPLKYLFFKTQVNLNFWIWKFMVSTVYDFRIKCAWQLQIIILTSKSWRQKQELVKKKTKNKKTQSKQKPKTTTKKQKKQKETQVKKKKQSDRCILKSYF